jgi:hypothetical protein
VNATPRPSRPPDERPPRPPQPPHPADGRGAAGPRRAVQVLYRQPGLCVTTDRFIVGGKQFPITELTRLRTARGPHDPLTARAIAVSGAVLAGVGVALGFTRDINQVGVRTFLVLGAAAFVPIVLAAVVQRLRPRSFELWGDYQGMTVLLFSSDHEWQYGQVTRALIRAQEMSRLGSVAEPVASTIPWLPPLR